MTRKQMRSFFGRASGLGSARRGVEDWWKERVTAVALMPLALWFIGSIIVHRTSDYTQFVSWLKMPFVTIMMVLLLIALFYHLALGLQVIVEDYIHSAMKFPALISVRLACFAGAAAGVLAVARIAFAA